MKLTSPSRFLSSLAATAVLITSGLAMGSHPNPALDFSATPGVPCGPGDLPETTQGRTPRADFPPSDRAAKGYTCNASQVSHVGSADGSTGGQGGYRVHRYTDTAGNVCAFYDTTLLFPVNARASAGPHETGVWVLNMNDPENPIHTDTLRTPAMQSPHESFSLNERKGLLGAVFSNPAFYHGQFDLYDVKTDCLHPTLMSTLPMGVLGHEGSFAPDGDTYYAASLYGHTLTAIDTSIPAATRTLWSTAMYNVHGMNLSDDGTLLYFADLARNGADSFEFAGSETKGLTILDVSEVQDRVLPFPTVREIKHLTWPHVGTPQTALPITIGGHPYLVEIDEFGGSPNNVGAARIIDIADPMNPFVVSNIRLAVNNPEHQTGDQKNDPTAGNSLGGYRGHYCGVPQKDDPGIVACTFIMSGLRVFDIHDPLHPKEIAYFNKPSTVDSLGTTGQGPQGSYAMSQPAFDFERRQIWYTDGNSGFYVVQIKNGVWTA